MAEGPPYKDAASVPKGRPTPTQDELNKIALGEPVEISKDGTPEDTVNVLQHNPRGTAPAHTAGHPAARTATGGRPS